MSLYEVSVYSKSIIQNHVIIFSPQRIFNDFMKSYIKIVGDPDIENKDIHDLHRRNTISMFMTEWNLNRESSVFKNRLETFYILDVELEKRNQRNRNYYDYVVDSWKHNKTYSNHIIIDNKQQLFKWDSLEIPYHIYGYHTGNYDEKTINPGYIVSSYNWTQLLKVCYSEHVEKHIVEHVEDYLNNISNFNEFISQMYGSDKKCSKVQNYKEFIEIYGFKHDNDIYLPGPTIIYLLTLIDKPFAKWLYIQQGYLMNVTPIKFPTGKQF